MKRYLEINAEGIAFHQPGLGSPFTEETMVPPSEVLFCDCQGVGVICHHIYADKTVTIQGSRVEEEATANFKQRHSKSRCSPRRQIFVDVTHRPEAQLGMYYDEATDSFSAPRL
jgi:hypothetical protein